MTGFVLDLYAGAGGWDVGAQILGLPTVGLEIEYDPCVTAKKAGHPRIQVDVATYPTAPFVGKATGKVGPPPCQPWSRAGNRLGEADRGRVHDLVNRFAAGDPSAERAWAEPGWADPRSHHAAQPVRWIRDLLPEWVALEQVPDVLPLWKHIGDVLRGWGYSVVTQVLCAADYGVPQTRERAILIASRVRPAVMPVTTHEKNPQPSLFGERLPWVSMADALNWGMTARPAGTIMCGRNGGGPEPLSGGSGARAMYARERREGRWALVNVAQENATARRAGEPAGTIYCSRPGNLRWTLDRPATTAQGDPRIGRPGHKDRAGGESQLDQDSLRVTVTVTEAAVLQSFPPDYPWRGNKTSAFMQVGNAIPPRLAAAVIGAAAGVDWQPAVDRFYATPDVEVAS